MNREQAIELLQSNIQKKNPLVHHTNFAPFHEYVINSVIEAFQQGQLCVIPAALPVAWWCNFPDGNKWFHQTSEQPKSTLNGMTLDWQPLYAVSAQPAQDALRDRLGVEVQKEVEKLKASRKRVGWKATLPTGGTILCDDDDRVNAEKIIPQPYVKHVVWTPVYE